MAVVNYPESNNGIYLKHNSLDFLQKFRSPLSHWKILGLYGVILIIAEIFSLIFSDQFVFLRLGIIGTFVISFVVLGISIWPYRRYKIFETRGAKGKMVFIPTTDGTDYWLYKDDQLEVIQAGLLHIYLYTYIFIIPLLIILTIMIGLFSFPQFISLISSPSWFSHFLAFFFFLLTSISLILVSVLTVLEMNAFRKLLRSPMRRLFINVWMPGCPNIPNFISMNVYSRHVRIPMRKSRSSLKPIELPIGKPIQMDFGTKTVSFTLSYTSPLPQTPTNLIVIVKDWSLLEPNLVPQFI